MTPMVPAPLLVPAAIALVGVVIALLADASDKPRAAIVLVAASLVAAGGVGLAMLSNAEPAVTEHFVTVRGFGSLGAVGYLLAAAAVIAGLRRFSAASHGVAIASLIALGAVFAAALAATVDLAVFLVSLAGLGVVAYALVAAAGTRHAEDSALRYFVQGAVASGLTVYGIALLLGTMDGASASAGALSATSGAWLRASTLASVLIVAVLAFKVGAFPFHSWVPDAYQSSYPAVAAYLGAVPKIAGLVALVTLVRGSVAAGVSPAALELPIQVLAAASLTFGAIGMLRQRSVSRLLGYSSIAQVGYALLALSAGPDGAGPVGVFAVTYALAACAAFVGVEAIGRLTPQWDGSTTGLAGLSRREPVLAACMAVVLLSLTGMPLLAGFWGKLVTFAAAIDAGLVWLAVLAGIAAVVSFGAYGSVIAAMYFHSEDDSSATLEGEASARGPLAVLLLLTIAIVLVGVLPLGLGIAPVYALFGL